MTMPSNVDIARRYVEALASGVDADGLATFYTTDVVQEEFPNRLVPNGATRDLEALRQGRLRGKALMASERYEILNVMGDGEQVAMELIWNGTIGVDAGPFKAGQSLRARFAVFLEFRDGRIARQRNYDCFDPF